jgi:hypothetical protein
MGWGRGRREAGHEEIQEVLMRALSGAITWLQAADILLGAAQCPAGGGPVRGGGAVALYDRRTLRPSRPKAPALEVQRILRREPLSSALPSSAHSARSPSHRTAWRASVRTSPA